MADGNLKFSIISLNDIVAEQTVLTLEFDVLQTENEQQTSFTISGSLVSDSLTNPIMLNFIGTNITVPMKHIPGDVNSDTMVNLKDLVTLAQVVAGWENIQYNIHAADINCDSTVDLQDVTHFARYLAGWQVQIF